MEQVFAKIRVYVGFQRLKTIGLSVCNPNYKSIVLRENKFNT